MNKYKFNLSARKRNAIGITYPITFETSADNLKQAIENLYLDYEHCGQFRRAEENGVKLEEQELFNATGFRLHN